MAITTYAQLTTLIQETAEDDGAEFLAYVPTAIDLAEERLFRELDLPDITTKVTGSLTANNNTITKPTGYRFMHYFKITSGSSIKTLIRRLDSYLEAYWPNVTSTGEPKYYSDTSSTQFLIAPTPDASYSYTMKYTKQPTKMSATNTSNYLLERCFPILFNACMKEVMLFNKSWDQAKVWEDAYQVLRADWNLYQARVRRDELETPQNPTGGPNTLTHTVNTKS